MNKNLKICTIGGGSGMPIVIKALIRAEFKNIKSEKSSKYLISSLKNQITNTVDFKYRNFTALVATRYNERATGASYWINDVRISQTINKIMLYADAQNIFNTTYYEVGAVPLPSRWFSLGLKLMYL